MTDRQRAITAVGFAAVLLFGVVLGVARRGERYDPMLGTRAITLRIDPNYADADRLCLLPQIASGKARAIVNEREANGPFTSAMDMERVSGIGAKTRAAFEPWIVIGSD